MPRRSPVSRYFVDARVLSIFEGAEETLALKVVARSLLEDALAAGRRQEPAPMTTTGEGILAGLRVVEAAAFVAAPLGGMTLAQMGADVIRIDTLGGGLDHRRWPVTDDDVSLFWCGLNKAQALGRARPRLGRGPRARDGARLRAGRRRRPAASPTFRRAAGWPTRRCSARRADLIQLTMQGDRHGGSAVDYTVNARVGVPYVTGPPARRRRRSTTCCRHGT